MDISSIYQTIQNSFSQSATAPSPTLKVYSQPAYPSHFLPDPVRNVYHSHLMKPIWSYYNNNNQSGEHVLTRFQLDKADRKRITYNDDKNDETVDGEKEDLKTEIQILTEQLERHKEAAHDQQLLISQYEITISDLNHQLETLKRQHQIEIDLCLEKVKEKMKDVLEEKDQAIIDLKNEVKSLKERNDELELQLTQRNESQLETGLSIVEPNKSQY